MAYISQPDDEAQLPAMQLPASMGAPLAAAPGSPVPGTPPRKARQSCFKRVESAEKLPSPRRFRRGSWGVEGGRSPPRSPLSALPLRAGAPRPAVDAPAAAAVPAAAAAAASDSGGREREADTSVVNIEQMRLRADSDAKYWAQIKFAHQLLMDSTCTELTLSEAAESNRSVLEPLFREAIAGQEADRLSAVAMLRVLRQLVAETDAELAQRRSLAAARPVDREDVKRKEGEAVEEAAKKAKCSQAHPEEELRAAPETPPAGPPATSTPTGPAPAWTPQRRSLASACPAWTPPRVARPATEVVGTPTTQGSGKLHNTA